MKWIAMSLVSFALVLSLAWAGPQGGAKKPRFGHASKGKACATTLDTCPKQGCGGGDGLLNTKKNRLDPPQSTPQVMTFEDFLHLQEESPTHWTQNQPRAEAEQLGEDTPVTLAGFLLGAHSGSPETCNCKLASEENNDYHINVVERSSDRLRDSIVVEMTPKMRAQMPEWRLDKINGLIKDPNNPPLVRVSGYLLFDSEHVSRSGGERATIWEIHPVTRFEFCSTGSNCAADSDEGWQDLHASP